MINSGQLDSYGTVALIYTCKINLNDVSIKINPKHIKGKLSEVTLK
jgi:hypothetical protein